MKQIEKDDDNLNREDLDFILESLKYTKKRFEEYLDYPSQEFKQKRIEEAEIMIKKIAKLKNKWIE